MTADRWPVGVPRPLVSTQEKMVREIGAVRSTPGHLVRVLAVLRCPKCTAPPVGDLRVLGLPDGRDHVRLWRGGTILTGTRRRDREAVKTEVSVVQQEGYRRRDVLGNEQYSALIDLTGLPAALPFWCDRCGALTFPLSKLRAEAERSAGSDTAPAVLRVHRDKHAVR